MIATDRLFAFVVAATLLIIVPGPSVLFVISRGVALGRRAALATVVGNAAGAAVQVTFVAIGLGAVVERSVLVFNVLKIAGAAYIVLLGIRALRQRRDLAEAMGGEVMTRSTGRILREGFVVGVSNPKTIVFFGAVLPQFVSSELGHVPLQLMLLGAIFVGIALISDSCWGLAAGTARHWLSGSPKRLALLGGTGGLVMIGLGLRLALTGRKD